MIFPEGVSVGHCDQGDAHALHVRVQMPFYVNAYSTGAFIEDSVGRSVVYKSGHGDSLLLAATEDVVPVIH